MKYGHLFWKLYGIAADRWDDLLYSDYLWMKATADDYDRQQRESSRG